MIRAVVERLDQLGVAPDYTLRLEIGEGTAWVYTLVGSPEKAPMFRAYDGSGDLIDINVLQRRKRYDLRG